MTTSEIAREVRAEQHVAVVCGRMSAQQLPEFLGGAFQEVMATVAAQGRRVTGMPFGRYVPVGDEGFDVEAGFPVDAAVTAQGRVEPSTLPGGPAASVVHRGSYDTVGAAYELLVRSVTESGAQPAGAPWEYYLDEPGVPEPRTQVVLPYTEGAAGRRGPGGTAPGQEPATAS